VLVTTVWAIGVCFVAIVAASDVDQSTADPAKIVSGLRLIVSRLYALTTACGVSLGILHTAPFVRFSCWFGGSLIVAVVIPMAAVVGMAESPQPNSDIGAAVGAFVLAAPIAVFSAAPSVALGIGIGIGHGIRQACRALTGSSV
jgi:hypothetical protein